MCLYWGITPYYFKRNENSLDTLQDQMIEQLRKKSLLDTDNKVVITHGDGEYFKEGTSNLIRVEIIQ